MCQKEKSSDEECMYISLTQDAEDDILNSEIF